MQVVKLLPTRVVDNKHPVDQKPRQKVNSRRPTNACEAPAQPGTQNEDSSDMDSSARHHAHQCVMRDALGHGKIANRIRLEEEEH